MNETNPQEIAPDLPAQTASEALPDRLSADPRSRYHQPSVFERDVGIRLNGKSADQRRGILPQRGLGQGARWQDP
jgi:hypothetical protein